MVIMVIRCIFRTFASLVYILSSSILDLLYLSVINKQLGLHFHLIGFLLRLVSCVDPSVEANQLDFSSQGYSFRLISVDMVH